MIKKLLIWIIKAYQLLISPLYPSCCRFYPSCSSYSIQALEKYPLHKGFFLSLKRLLKCHPYSQGGFDPVL